jgi:hypothetical protein
MRKIKSLISLAVIITVLSTMLTGCATTVCAPRPISNVQISEDYRDVYFLFDTYENMPARRNTFHTYCLSVYVDKSQNEYLKGPKYEGSIRVTEDGSCYMVEEKYGGILHSYYTYYVTKEVYNSIKEVVLNPSCPTITVYAANE